ncbi:MAG: hypothetical protein E6248_11645 [Clostridium sp.]|uniref:hypothetical protein n=1 Tax=Clostridium sp. TaxID=1506 RepID=UPI0029151728|nr:hypothetical protein [Clostridium sp.]MDU5111095.1 hypothetical protein [Clostridium sp.]
MDKFKENQLNDKSVDIDERFLKNFRGGATKNIAIGFMFTVFTFNFLWLQYILPTLAAVLLYIGFRDLRKENKALKVAWKFSIINMAFNVLSLIYKSTPLSVNFNNIFLSALILIVFHITFLITFRKGIREVFNKANVEYKKDPIMRLIIWRIIVTIIALTGLWQIWFISIPMIIYYFYIIRLLYKLSYDIESINCMTSNTNIRFSDKSLILGYLTSCIFLVAISCVLSNHIRLDSVEVIPVKEYSNRNLLIDEGIPLKIVRDILDEDIAVLKDIVNVETVNIDFDFDKDTEKDLEATTIFIELNYNEIYAIEYFNWGEKGPYWQDGIAISNSRDLELINGRLIYENEGINYASEIPRLNGGAVESTDVFGQLSQENKITGAINYPFNSKEQRGYIFYKINIEEGAILGTNIADYTHYNHPFRIPYTEVEKSNLSFTNNLGQNASNYRTKSRIELDKQNSF